MGRSYNEVMIIRKWFIEIHIHFTMKIRSNDSLYFHFDPINNILHNGVNRRIYAEFRLL